MFRLKTVVLIATVCLAALLGGCVSSGRGVEEDADTLNRWLDREPDEDAAVLVPERETTPPPQVTLESLEVTGEPVAPDADLPAPDYYSFTLTEPSYVSVTVQSDAGAAISLIDRSIGAFVQDGSAGYRDGRIDTLLDEGEYRVQVQASRDEDNPRIQVHQFSEIQADSELLMNSEPGTLHTSTLGDHQQRSFWVEVANGEPLILEAMARSLHAVRIWADGVWVTPTQPAVTNYSPVTGRSMGYVQFAQSLPAGAYLVTFYGGEPRAWEEEPEDLAGENAFHIRYGAKYLGGIVDANTQISPMGRDAYMVSGDVTLFEVENVDFVPVRVGVSRSGSGTDRYRAVSDVQLERDDDSTRRQGSVSRSSSPRWLFVEGTPGDTVRLRALPERSEYEIDRPVRGSQYLVSTVSSLSADHAMDATPFILRDSTRTMPEEVIRSEALPVGSQPLVRRINAYGGGFFLVDLDRAGEWAFVHDMPEDSGVAVAMIPMRELYSISRPDLQSTNPAVFDLEAGQHMVMVQSYRPGIMSYALYYRGSSAGAADRRAESLLAGDVPVPRGDVTFLTYANEIAQDVDHVVALNQRGETVSALYVEQLPLSLTEPVPITLGPGEELNLPISPATPGTLSTGYDSIRIRDGSRVLTHGDVVSPGRRTVTAVNTGSASVTFVLRLDPVFTASFSAPAIPELADVLPTLRPGPAVFHDYAAGETRQFLLVVEEPAFYELQTTGRLSTRITTRTRVTPGGFTAAANGPGRNALVQAYFRPGSYLVEVTSERPSAGRAGLIMSPLPMENLGRLSENARYRAELDPGVGLRSDIAVAEGANFAFLTEALYGSPTTRLEDADAWPVSGSWLAPGLYAYYSWPQTVWNRRITSYTRLPDPVEFSSDGVWELELGQQVSRTWMENAGRDPQQFALELPATLPVTVFVSSGMEWWFEDAGGTRIVQEEDSGTLHLPPGRIILNARSGEENNSVRYEVRLSTAALADGLQQPAGRFPAEIQVVAEQPGIYEIWSTGTHDIRAELSTEDGTVIAAGDDRPGDWNFHFSRYLPAGVYQLTVTETFAGYATSTITCRKRDEVWVEDQELPVQTRLELDQAIIGVPFTTGRDAPAVRITSDSSAAALELYRDDTLIAEGTSGIFIPLLPDTHYVLRLRNESLSATPTGLVIAEANPAQLSWNGLGPLELPPGAARVENELAIAVDAGDAIAAAVATASAAAGAGETVLLLSGKPESSATVPARGILANPGGVFWTWNPGEKPAVVEPLSARADRSVAMDLTDDDLTTRVECPPETVSILTANTVAGFVGIAPVTSGSSTLACDWSVADTAQSSTLLGMAGEFAGLVRVWDGMPRATARQVDLSVLEFDAANAQTVPLDRTVTVQPGGVAVIDTAELEATRLLLAPDLVGIAVVDERTVRTVAARLANLATTVPGGGTVYVVNTGLRDGNVRATAAPPAPELTVTAEGFTETVMDASGSGPSVFAARVQPGGDAPSTLAVWATDPEEVMLLTDSGRRIGARPPGDSEPWWTLPAVSGRLVVSADGGPVTAWFADDTAATAQMMAQDAGRPAGLAEGDNLMVPGPQAWRFTLTEEAFVLATTANRGMTALVPGGEQTELAPQVALGAGGSRRVFAVLGPGSHSVITRPVADEAQPAPLRFQVLQPILVEDPDNAQTSFLEAGDRAVFAVEVTSDWAVGIGLWSETDDYDSFLLDANLRLVGSGRIFYRELEDGIYYLLVENGGNPMNVRPVTAATGGSRTGVPREIIEGYTGE